MDRRLAPIIESLMKHFEGIYDFSRYELLSDTEKQEVIDKILEHAMSIVDLDGYLNSFALNQLSQYFGILALTAVSTHTLMWAHYADSHKGVCIGLGTAVRPLNLARPIQYMNEIPVIEYMNFHEDETVAMFKSTLWAYEGEWRVLKRGAGTVELGARAVKELIFGFACPDKTVLEVAQRAMAANPRISLFRMERDAATFGLKKIPIILKKTPS